MSKNIKRLTSDSGTVKDETRTILVTKDLDKKVWADATNIVVLFKH